MAEHKIVKLKFVSPLHLGHGQGDAYDTGQKLLHSDTISGAIASVYCSMFSPRELLPFMKKYRLSSAFPYAGGSVFLPRPLAKIPLRFSDLDDYRQLKKLKKIEYIDYNLWQRIVSGEPVISSKYCLSADGRFLFSSPDLVQKVYRDELQQRVFVPRTGEDAMPYYFERRFFAANCGLYFFLDTESPEVEAKVLYLLQVLGMQGFGTDKSIGNGQFEATLSSVNLNIEKQSHAHMLISLACPEQNEISADLLEKSSYQLAKRGGFVAGTGDNRFRHLRKRSIYMFTEGSVFIGKTPSGKIENLRPEWNDVDLHPVYRDGRSFSLPLKFTL
ncbi:type III-A CRISPR-associated RAMP protein Csm4 [Mangrovibacterium sp.]|uniref:type III-A CRISPR-associated RAMP protein Csm4 n=1 Tax=Mangrovibacterium sp. TaxID=1961364 RepID=UPI003564984C